MELTNEKTTQVNVTKENNPETVKLSDEQLSQVVGGSGMDLATLVDTVIKVLTK